MSGEFRIVGGWEGKVEKSWDDLGDVTPEDLDTALTGAVAFGNLTVNKFSRIMLPEYIETKVHALSLRILRDWAELYIVTFSELLELGTTAKLQGAVSNDKRVETQQIFPSQVVSVLPPWTPGDLLLDGTFTFTQEDLAQRYSVFPDWAQTSCAVDSIIFIAIQLNAGICRVDQCGTSRVLSLTPPARLLRLIVELPWGTIQQHQRNRLRTCLVGCLDEYGEEFPDGDPPHFQASDSVNITSGSSMSIKLVTTILLDRLPQLSWTMATMARGCRGQSMGPPKKFKRLQVVTVSADALTIGQGVNDFFGHRPKTKGKACDAPNCKMDHDYIGVVVDRLPPVLTVFLHEPHSASQLEERRFTAPLYITYFGPGPEIMTVSYQFIGAIVEEHGCHHVGVWVNGVNVTSSHGPVGMAPFHIGMLREHQQVIVAFYGLMTKVTTQ